MNKGIYCYDKYSDLYNKACRDYKKLGRFMSGDDVFNFLCTVDHLLDWAAQDETLSKDAQNEAIEMMKRAKDKNNKDYILYTIRGLCNSGKHYVRHSPDREIERKTRIISGPFGFGPCGMGPIGMIVYSFDVEHNGNVVPFLTVAKEAMDVWDDFSNRHLM